MDKQEAINGCRRMIPPGTTVWCVVRSVSRSGMSRRIDCYVIQDGQLLYVSYYVANAIGWSVSDKGILSRGCGMDMGFHLVGTLSHSLYGNEGNLRARWI